MSRYQLESDPAWDRSDTDEDGTLAVELTWMPDALAGRNEEIVASPSLVRELHSAGITGFTTAPARGYFREDSFGVQPGTVPPELVRLVVGSDATADLFYLDPVGLVVSEEALAVLRTYCTKLEITALGP